MAISSLPTAPTTASASWSRTRQAATNNKGRDYSCAPKRLLRSRVDHKNDGLPHGRRLQPRAGMLRLRVDAHQKSVDVLRRGGLRCPTQRVKDSRICGAGDPDLSQGIEVDAIGNLR